MRNKTHQQVSVAAQDTKFEEKDKDELLKLFLILCHAHTEHLRISLHKPTTGGYRCLLL